MEKLIDSSKDVEYYLVEEGMSPLEVSVLHWEENLKFAEMDEFDEITITESYCALCHRYSSVGDGALACSRCPLKQNDEFCNDDHSIWKHIYRMFEKLQKFHSHYDFLGKKTSLAYKTEEYKIKDELLEYIREMTELLDKLWKEENLNASKKIGEPIRLMMEKEDGSILYRRVVELNDSGIYVDYETHRETKVCKVIREDTNEVIWGEGYRKDKKEMYVPSMTDYEKNYVISWYENKDGKEYDASCSCPAFVYRRFRPCKHLIKAGFGVSYIEQEQNIESKGKTIKNRKEKCYEA